MKSWVCCNSHVENWTLIPYAGYQGNENTYEQARIQERNLEGLAQRITKASGVFDWPIFQTQWIQRSCFSSATLLLRRLRNRLWSCFLPQAGQCPWWCTLFVYHWQIHPHWNERLEHSPAMLSTRLDAMIQDELPVDYSVFWTDSTCIIRYSQNEERRFTTFVANRVATIREQWLLKQWPQEGWQWTLLSTKIAG